MSARSRIERLMVLVDIKGWQWRTDPRSHGLLLLDCVEKMLKACEQSCKGCVWAYKLFDSSLSPLRSRRKIEELVGNWAIQVRFDSVRTISGDGSSDLFRKFSSAIKCLEFSFRQSIYELEDSEGRADFVVRSLQELLTDYIWEPLVLNEGLLEEEKGGSVHELGGEKLPETNKNCVFLFSGFPSTRRSIVNFINENESRTEAASESELLDRFFQKFRFVHESFRARSLHLCWIDVLATLSAPEYCKEVVCTSGLDRVIKQAAARAAFERMNWILVALDTLAISSRLIPFSLVWRTLAHPSFQLIHGAALSSAEVCIHVKDRDDEPIKDTLCKLDVFQPFERLLSDSCPTTFEVCSVIPKDLTSSFQKLVPHQVLLCRVAAAGKFADLKRVTRNQNKRLHLLDSFEKKPKRGQRDRHPMGDHIFVQLQQQALDFQPGRPAWQLFLLNLEREQSLAVMEVRKESDPFFALLEPWNVNYSILSIVERRSCLEKFLVSSGFDTPICDMWTPSSGQDGWDDVDGPVSHRFNSSQPEASKEPEVAKPEGVSPLSKKQKLVESHVSDPASAKMNILHSGIAKSTCPVIAEEGIGWQSLLSIVLKSLSSPHSVPQSFVKLEDLYLKSSKRSKSLKILNCWMRQTKLRSDQTLGSLKHGPPLVGSNMGTQESPCAAGFNSTDIDQCLPSDQGPQTHDVAIATSPGVSIHDTLDEKLEVSSQLTMESANLYIASLHEKIQNCLCSSEIDIHSFAKRVVADAQNALHVMLKSKSLPDKINSSEANACTGPGFAGSIGVQLIELLLQRPKKLAIKYKKCRPPLSTAETVASDIREASYSHRSEEKVREYELQIKFRMEILALNLDGASNKQVKDTLVAEICRLLENIQFNLPGGIFDGESLFDFSNRVIKSRYRDSLPDIVNEIYTSMEFNGHDESTETLCLSETPREGRDDLEMTTIVVPMLNTKSGSSTHHSLGTEEDSLSQSDNIYSSSSLSKLQMKDAFRTTDYGFPSKIFLKSSYRSVDDDAPEQKLKAAQEKRERAKRFSHFASRAKDLLRVRVVKQPSQGLKKQQKAHRETSKAKASKVYSNEVVLETPFAIPERKRVSSTANGRRRSSSQMTLPTSVVALSGTNGQNAGPDDRVIRSSITCKPSASFSQRTPSVKRQLIPSTVTNDNLIPVSETSHHL